MTDGCSSLTTGNTKCLAVSPARGGSGGNLCTMSAIRMKYLGYRSTGLAAAHEANFIKD
jgi:hypothetical protein